MTKKDQLELVKERFVTAFFRLARQNGKRQIQNDITFLLQQAEQKQEYQETLKEILALAEHNEYEDTLNEIKYKVLEVLEDD